MSRSHNGKCPDKGVWCGSILQEQKMKRLANAAIGFAVGIFTLPLADAAWPFAAAWFMWHETDEDGEDGDTEKHE